MVGQLKEDVAEWYQGLSAHMRIEAMCTLIDLSMPFEIRFLGSLIEHLGRKDFGSLREAESKANSFTNANPDDKKKLLKSLAEVTTGGLVNGTQYVNPLMHPNSFNDSPGNRPSPTHSSDSRGRQSSISSEALHGSDSINDHGLSSEPSNSHDSLGPKGNTKGASTISNHIGCSSEEETESMCIANDHKRRKLILYISVLQPTNHDCANLYYTVLSDIEDSPALAWLEDLDKDAQEEVSLLYTLASRHPAFTFEQRMFLGTVANRVNEIIGSKFSRGSATPQQTAQAHNANPTTTQPVYYNHAAFQPMDPKYAGGYYFFSHGAMHLQQAPHQPSSVSSNGEQLRNTAVSGPFPAYAPFGPYFVSHPHHPAALPHPTALNPNYAQNFMGATMPIPSSAAMGAPSGPNMQQAVPSVACSNNSSVVQGNSVTPVTSNHQLTSSKGQSSQPPPHVSSSSNSVAQQSCLSTPSRTSSSVPFQSEANSVDGDSAEESSENCDWNSPESSPFESPPQSLTPSRSQSPPSGIPNSTSVQAVSITGHSSTFLVTSSSGSSVPYGGPVNSNSCSSASTIVKTEIHSSSGFVITTATSSTSSTTCSTSTSNTGNGPIHSNSISSSSNNNTSGKTGSSSTTPHHPQPLQSHHPPGPPPTSSSSSMIRNQPKMNPPSVSGNGSNNSNQSFSNHPPPPTVVSSSMISVSQQQPQQTLPPPQMMSPSVPVHMQQQTSVLTSVNNVGGIVSHSMSSANSPLAVAFAQQTHGAHNNIGLNTNLPPPPSQNSYPCFPHMNTAVSFGGMNAGAAYRAPSQGVLTRNPYVQSHAAANALLGNQMVIKGSEVQRGVHNVHGSLRQKAPLQNTPKRRNNVGGSGGLVNMSGMVGGPHGNNSQSTSGKGDEVSESLKDSRTNEVVVSANPPTNKGVQQQQQQQERTTGGGKSYHHVTNGLVNTLTSNSGAGGAVLPGNSLPNISANNNSGVINNPSQSQASVALSSSSNPGGQVMQTAAGKAGEDGLLGDGGAVLDNYPTVNQLPYHINGPQLYGHPPGPYIQLPNGFMAHSSYYPNPVMAAAAAAAMGAGGPPVPPSTEIMMNPAGVSHFSFPFTIPQSFSSPPTTGGGNKGINNAKDTSKSSNSLHGGNGGGGGGNPSSGGGGNGGDSSNKTIPTNHHDGHGCPPTYPVGPSYYTAVSRTPSQPNRNNRGVILDIGGALGNSSLSPVNVDVAVMPPLDELVETVHRPRKISCYNCGASNHLGPDCKEGSMEEMTRHQFRVNFSGPSSVTADGKDGD